MCTIPEHIIIIHYYYYHHYDDNYFHFNVVKFSSSQESTFEKGLRTIMSCYYGPVCPFTLS